MERSAVGVAPVNAGEDIFTIAQEQHARKLERLIPVEQSTSVISELEAQSSQIMTTPSKDLSGFMIHHLALRPLLNVLCHIRLTIPSQLALNS